jgi:hypothetical protein
MSTIEFNFSSTGIKNISLHNVTHTENSDVGKEGLTNKQKKMLNYANKNGGVKSFIEKAKNAKKGNAAKITNQYHYLTADLDNHSGSPNLYSHIRKLFYTLENLCIVGPLSNKKTENANLILSFKSINDYNSKSKPSMQYMCFPLNINTNANNEHFLTGVLNGASNKTISAVDLSELIPSSGNNEYKFEHLHPKNDMIDIDIYFYSKVTSVYYDPSLENASNPKSLKWITPDVQSDTNKFEPVKLKFFMDNPTSNKNNNDDNFTTLWDWEPVKESMETIKATKNDNLSEEEQIYIQCAPAGASEQTEMVHTSAKKNSKKGGSHNENSNLSFLIIGTIVIIINILVVGLGYKMVYRVLSRFFIENVIESRSSKHADKRRGNPFEMFLYWLADIIPHFLQIQWGEGNKRTSSESLIRVFVYAFYAFLVLTVLYSLKTKNMSMFHFALFIIAIYVFDVFFFFIQVRNVAPDQYQTMKEEKLTS